MLRTLGIVTVLMLAVVAVADDGEETLNQPLECMAGYKFKEFPIIAWCFHNYVGSDYTMAYARKVEAAGFNVALETGYMAEFYEKTTVKMLLSTMISDTLKERMVYGKTRTHPIQKGTSPKEAYAKYGKNQSLIGFHIGSKYGRHFSRGLIAPVKETEGLGAGLFPWIAHCGDLKGHVTNGVTILSIETFRRDKWDAFGFENKGWQFDKRNRYCDYMEWGRRASNANNLAFWPLYPGATASKGLGEVVGSAHGASELRFMTLAPIAYGAQGLVCFGYSTTRDVWDPEKGLTYKTIAKVNPHVTQVIGPRVLGHRSLGVYWAKPITSYPKPKVAPGALIPGGGKFIEKMDDALIAGVLTREKDFKSGANTPHYVMLVDAHTAPEKQETEFKPRTVTLSFGPQVRAVEVIGAPGEKNQIFEREVKITLAPGDGRLLKMTVDPEAFKPPAKAPAEEAKKVNK